MYLSALHFNENCDRQQAVDENGDLKYQVRYPRHKKGHHVVGKVKTDITFGKRNTGNALNLNSFWLFSVKRRSHGAICSNDL